MQAGRLREINSTRRLWLIATTYKPIVQVVDVIAKASFVGDI